MSTGLSPWCHPAPGTRHSAAQHGMCQMQLDKHPERTCTCVDPPHTHNQKEGSS